MLPFQFFSIGAKCRLFKSPVSLRSQLLWGILLPTLAVVAFNTIGLYRQALKAADLAYDRTLLASAKSIGELLEVGQENGKAYLKSNLLYSALEAFEADNRSRLYYKVTGFDGEIVSGFNELPGWNGKIPQAGPYSALVDFYDDFYLNTRVRVAVLLQPVTWIGGQGMAIVQVAETLELRQTLARSLLLDTLWRQALLLLLIISVVILVVHSATRPIERMSQNLRRRSEQDLRPVPLENTPVELVPFVTATNQMMEKLSSHIEQQKKFVRDASHQLRTPLAVLSAQVQSAQRGDIPAVQAFAEIRETVSRATELANQMLALAKVEQLRREGLNSVSDLSEAVREVALDLSALIADKHLDFEIRTQICHVRARDWALRELTRNLLHNAIRHSPIHGSLSIDVEKIERHAHLLISDSGEGIPAHLRDRLFEPFAARGSLGGSGLGLSICQDIVLAIGGRIELVNRVQNNRTVGLDAHVWVPLQQVAQILQSSEASESS